MTEIAYFLNARQDGGFRSGIDINGGTVWHHFVAGTEDSDPALLWWVDVNCKGVLPRDPDAVRSWMLDKSRQLSQFMTRAAQDIEGAGFDVDLEPFRRDYQFGEVRVTIVASAIRRVDAREMGTKLKELAGKWVRLVEELEQPSKV